MHVNVEYPWLPPKCSRCNILGHGDRDCLFKAIAAPVKIWMPKKTKMEGKELVKKSGEKIEDIAK